MSERPPLATMPQRTLNCTASFISGQDARVAISHRVRAPMVVVMRGRCLFLHPSLTGLFDLCLGAQLLVRRGAMRELHAEGGQIDAGLTRAWTNAALSELSRRYSRVLKLAGYYHPARNIHRELPWIVWDDAPLRPIEPADLTGQPGMMEVPDVGPDIAADEYRILIEAIEAGKLPTQQFPELPHLRVATIPVDVKVAAASEPDLEQLEHYLNELRDAQERMISCYRRKSEGLFSVPRVSQLRYAGMRLDGSRLAHAAVGQCAGKPVKIFRKPNPEYRNLWDPSQHVAVCGFDMNCTIGGSLRGNRRTPAILASIFERLEIDFVMYLFHDRVELSSDGRPLLLHFVVKAKAFHEPVDNAFWHRLAYLISPRREAIPGQPASLLPLHLQTLEQELTQIDQIAKHHYRSLWLISGPMHELFRRGYQGDSFQFETTIANIADRQLEALHQRYQDARLDTDLMIVPENLAMAASPAGRVAKMIHHSP